MPHRCHPKVLRAPAPHAAGAGRPGATAGPGAARADMAWRCPPSSFFRHRSIGRCGNAATCRLCRPVGRTGPGPGQLGAPLTVEYVLGSCVNRYAMQSPRARTTPPPAHSGQFPSGRSRRTHVTPWKTLLILPTRRPSALTTYESVRPSMRFSTGVARPHGQRKLGNKVPMSSIAWRIASPPGGPGDSVNRRHRRTWPPAIRARISWAANR